jgi:iron(III) transport system permease protein
MPVGVAVALVVLPILVAGLSGLLAGGGAAWETLRAERLAGAALTTLALLGLSGALMLVMAVPAAWLVTLYRFPGRAAFEGLLILPLAVPGYVLAYAWADLMGVGGPVQGALRNATGWGARDYVFPEVSGVAGAAFVLACGLYPYVYLAARAAFLSQSVCTLEASRTLGAGPLRRFMGVALPAARPAIVAGLALALMEVAADYGASAHLGVQSLSVTLFAHWKAHGDAASAARIALLLMALVFMLMALERWQRGGAGSQATSIRWRALSRPVLSRAKGWLATGVCGLVLGLGFVVPVGRLIWMALEPGAPIAPVGEALRNSLVLAGAGTGVAFVLAVILALAQRAGGLQAQIARAAAASGYAMPGAVLALGALVVAAAFTRWGWTPGLTLPLALTMLVWVYASRFAAAGAGPIGSALERAPDSVRHAARALGANPVQRLLRVDLPIAAAGALAGGLIVFTEILKELPATLMLRPFDWDTLAVRAHAYASDERLAAAALPSLLITLAGLAPVMLLSWQMTRSRPGHTGNRDGSAPTH